MPFCVAGVAVCDIRRVRKNLCARPLVDQSGRAYGKSHKMGKATKACLSRRVRRCGHVVFCCRRGPLWHSMCFSRNVCVCARASWFTLCTLHSTLYTPHSTLHTLHSTLYTPHFTLHTLPSTLHTLHSHSTLHTLHSAHFTLYTPHFTLHTLQTTLSTLYSPLISTPHLTLHTLHSTLHTLHSTLYTSHFTLHTLLFKPTLRTLQHTVHITHSTPHFTLTLHTLHSTLHTSHSTLCTRHFTSSTPHTTLYTPHFTLTLSTPHFTLHTLHSNLYTPHFTLHTPHLHLILLALTSVSLTWSAFGFVGFSCFVLLPCPTDFSSRLGQGLLLCTFLQISAWWPHNPQCFF